MKILQIKQILALIFGTMTLASLNATSFATAPSPPNLVRIHDRLVTSGQPTAEWLATVKAQGYDAVIYLAPLTVGDAVKEEPLILSRQGVLFVNIPIKFDNPTEQGVENFSAVMNALDSKVPRKILVHCQINLRASSMVFLYRVIVRKENPNTAYESVAKVWVPEGTWKQLIQEQLKKHQINFEPF